jgi:hypothetical protein
MKTSERKTDALFRVISNEILFIVSLTIIITLCYTFIDNYEGHNIRITPLP